jgi:hypothetical protein
MCLVNFCWKCYDPDIWEEAVLLLFVTHFGGDTTPEEHAVQWGTIKDITYADKTQHARIREVDRIVMKIRQSYDTAWDVSQLAEDQRLIYAVCGDVENRWRRGHGPPFVCSFEDKCVESGFQLGTPNKYQLRLEIYRSIKGDFVEGLDKCLYDGTRGYSVCESPKDYKYDDDPYQSCNNASCFFDRMKEGTLSSIPDTKDLQKCSRCLVVRYCSKECQRKDWKEHKKQCENLSIWRKDQDKIHELAQQF